MKTHIFILLGLWVLVGACQTSDVSIMVSALRPLEADCKVNTEYSMAKGALNINAIREYLLSVEMESLIEGVDLEGASDHLLSSEKENRVVLTEWTRQYFIYGAGGTSKLILEEQEPMAGILEPNAASKLLIPLSMFGPSGAAAIKHLLEQRRVGAEAGAPLGVEVVVRFRIHGKMVSSGKKVETAPIDFPVFVYLGEPLPTCAEGERLAPVGPCGLHGGQDAFIPICCVLNPSSGECGN
jgi:hypothetical protein